MRPSPGFFLSSSIVEQTASYQRSATSGPARSFNLKNAPLAPKFCENL
jgi:hypothetical protein